MSDATLVFVCWSTVVAASFLLGVYVGRRTGDTWEWNADAPVVEAIERMDAKRREGEE